MKTPVLIGSLAASIIPLTDAVALAQADPSPEVEATVEDEGGRDMRFVLRGGAAMQFETSVDNGGEFDLFRANAGVNATTALTPDVELSFRAQYDYELYDFAGNTGFGALDPWEDIHTIGFGAIFSGKLSNDLTLFGGPVMQFAAESGADWKDGFTGGGVIGASYRLSNELTLGGGFGVVNQLEDDAKFFPVIIINWELTDQLRLTSRSGMSATGDAGIELIYDWGGGWETAIGAAYRARRFRLDDSPNAASPDGLGEDESVPLWGRISYHFNSASTFSVIGGATAFGDIELMNDSGQGISKEDYDPAAFVGVLLTLRF